MDDASCTDRLAELMGAKIRCCVTRVHGARSRMRTAPRSVDSVNNSYWLHRVAGEPEPDPSDERPPLRDRAVWRRRETAWAVHRRSVGILGQRAQRRDRSLGDEDREGAGRSPRKKLTCPPDMAGSWRRWASSAAVTTTRGIHPQNGPGSGADGAGHRRRGSVGVEYSPTRELRQSRSVAVEGERRDREGLSRPAVAGCQRLQPAAHGAGSGDAVYSSAAAAAAEPRTRPHLRA